jgi:hypothetical protein
MTDAVAAAIAIFGLGLLSGLAAIAGLQRRTRSISPSSRASVALRLRAVRRSRVAAVEQRVDALERVVSSRALSVERHDRARSLRGPVADPDALAALLALGYRRSDAVARLAALGEATSTTEERVAAALRLADEGSTPAPWVNRR